MSVIDLDSRRNACANARRAKGQMAALEFLRQEIAASGYDTAAQLVSLAILSIAEQVKGDRGN